MDPALDPPPLSAQPTAALHPVAAPAPAPVAVNPVPANSVPVNHPPYAEMITTAITALNERDGSSSRAIAKYVETHYPPTDSTLLTEQLRLMKANGLLQMVKKSYALPTRSASAAVNGTVNAVSADPAPSGSKRRPGRPPKPKPDAGQAAVPVFAPPINMNAAPAVAPTHIAAAPAGTPARGRGRPPKRGVGRPPLSGSVGKQRGRPRRNPVVAPPPAAKGSGRPRGRPPKAINVAEGAAPVGGGQPAVPVPVGGKRRGRPPKAGGLAKKPRNVTAVQPRKTSGKPVGRPRKTASTNQTPQDSKPFSQNFSKLRDVHTELQKKVAETANVIRPFLNNDAAINALNELETQAARAFEFDAEGPSQQPQPQS